MIALGPFRLSEVERIEAFLHKCQVNFEAFIDEDLKERTLASFHEQASSNPRGAAGSLDLRVVFFEIDGSDFDKVKDEFEKFGITAPSDGSWELAEEADS